MNKKQKNKLTMYDTVDSYLDKSSPVYSDIEEFVNHKISFKSKIDEIGEKEDKRNKATKGKALDKQATRSSVTNKSLAVYGALYAFAKKTGNIVLAEKADKSKSKLNLLSDVLFVIELESLKAMAAENSSALVAYGISADKLAALETTIDNYSNAISAKESGGAVKTGATKTLVTLFREGDALLDSIDKLVEGFRESNKEFYAGYKASRVIKDLGIRHAPVPETPPTAPAPAPKVNGQ